MHSPAIAETLAGSGFGGGSSLLSRPELAVLPGGGEDTHLPPQGDLSIAEKDIESAPALPQVISVAELPNDQEYTAEAQRRVKQRLVGNTVIANTVEIKKKPIKNTLEGLQWAAEGDEEGRQMIRQNITTETIEQAFKVNVIELPLEVNADGDISQHGQYMDDVQHNAFQLASDDEIIKPRTLAEVNNSARLKQAFKEGLLKTHAFVVLSLCAEGVSDKKLDELNFFSKTKSLSVQAVYEKDGELKQDVAMVAGVTEEGGERHDRKMVEGFGRLAGVDYEGLTAAEIIDKPMLIPLKYMKNGVVDIAAILDEINDGTFMGQNIPEDERMSYADYKEFCARRARGLDDTIDAVEKQLLAEVNKFEKTLQASRRLSKLVEQNLVDRALDDKTIDPSVFGPESAKSLTRARELKAIGYHHEAQAFMQIAKARAQGGSCPSALISDLEKMATGEISQTISKENAWAGGEPRPGTCVNCDKKTMVGVKSWCKGCIKGHCG